jgi:hypothetical protein
MAGKHQPRNQEPKAHIQCAHDDCREPAILSRKLRGGWAKLCKHHDLLHVQLEANEFCEANGLFTRQEKMDWIRKKLASPRPTPYEHWLKVSQTPGLLPMAYEMARSYFGRHGREDTGETTGTVK